MQYIYKILNIKNEKFYIGRTKGLKVRWNNHASMLEHDKHHCIHLQRAWNKYGKNTFSFEIVEIINTGSDEEDLKLAKQIEQDFLDIYMPKRILYNSSSSSETGVLIGEKHHFYGMHPKDWIGEEAFEKLMNKWKNRFGEDNPFYGKKHSEETINILRKKCSLFGEKNGMFGKKHTEEYKKRKSEMMKGRYLGENNPFYRKEHTQETKKKISQSKKGQLKGIPKSAEQKRKMSLSNKKRKPITIDTVTYISCNEAAKILKIDRKTIAYRANSKNFPNYQFINN